MNTQTLKQPRTWLVSAAILLTVAGVFVARTAFAKITVNSIDPVGIVADHDALSSSPDRWVPRRAKWVIKK